MRKLFIIHLGMGNVGKEIKRQIVQQKRKITNNLNISLEYIKEFTSKNSDAEIKEAIKNIPMPFVLIDTTASDKTISFIKMALKRDGFAVLANKKSLAGTQENFESLHRVGRKRLLYECVVGAGLPVIRTLKDLLTTGDEVVEIQGCLSGTLGFIFTQLDSGKSFSESVIDAREKGFTEPDPRDDLSGLDVARKALILARIMGKKIELKDIALASLYPEDMDKLRIGEFMKQVNKLDNLYKARVENAKKEGKVLRFVAKISQKKCSVGLIKVNALRDIGSLNGPDNLIVFKTKRYAQYPLVVKGPGAGIFVAAAGVFADVLSVAKMI